MPFGCVRHSARLNTSFPRPDLHYSYRSGMSLPSSSKQAARRPARHKISFQTNEHQRKAAYRYNKKENLSLFWKWSVLDIYPI